MKNLLETGKVVRQRTKLDRKIKLKRTDPDVQETPGWVAALGAMGIAKGDMAAARQAALVELRKATPTATADEFTPEQIFQQITKDRTGTKTAEAVALELKAAKDAFLAAGKVEIPLNLEMSPTDLRANIPVKAGPTDLHEAPAFSAALEGLGVEPKDRQKAIDDALAKLRAGAASGTTEFKFTAEQILKQVVKDRVKTTPPADPPEKAESELSAATKAFQATQDNRLLRAWEYTVAAMAELGEEQGQLIRAGTLDAASNRVDSVPIPATGPDVARLAQFRLDVKAKFDKLFKEKVKIRFDASVETEKSADGSSDRGVWVMEEAATRTKITDKAGQDAVIKKLMAEALADFKDPKEQGWGGTLTANLHTGPLTTKDPLKKSAAYYGAKAKQRSLLKGAELEATAPVPPVALGQPLDGPAKKFVDMALDGLDSKYAALARTKLETLAATQPSASLDQVQKVVNDCVAEYLASPDFQPKKDVWTRINLETIFSDLVTNGTEVKVPLDPNALPLASLVAQSMNNMDPDWIAVIQPKIEQRLSALQSTGAAEIDLPQIGQILNDVMHVDLANEDLDSRNLLLADLNKNLTEGLAGDAPVYEPTFPAAGPDVTRMIQQWAQADPANVSYWETAATAEVTALAKDPLTLKDIRQALDKAGTKYDETNAKNAVQEKFDKAVFEDTTGPMAEMPLAYPAEGKLKDMIDKSLAHFDEGQRIRMKKKAQEELDKLKPATAVSLPAVRKMLDDLFDVHMKADDTKEEDSSRNRLTNNMAIAVLDELGPPVETAEVENLVGKVLKKLQVAEPEPAATVKAAAVSAVQALGAPGVSLAEVEKEVATALKASSLPADQVLETLREERRPPLDLAKVEPLIAVTLKKLQVPAAKTAKVRKAALEAATQLGTPQVRWPTSRRR
jgi:hypothetical protein